MRARCLQLFSVIAWVATSAAASSAAVEDFNATTATVGRGAEGLVTPVNQLVAPAGILIELPGSRPQAVALSPDGRLLVAAGLSHELIVLDPQTASVRQRVPLPAATRESEPARVPATVLEPDTKAQLGYGGLIFSPDGSRIYMANVLGDVKVFAVGKDRAVTGLTSLPLPPADAPERKTEIPAGIALSADGKRLYIALNLSNRLAELDAATGRVLRLWNVGVAPCGVVIAGQKIYVSNWGGRRPGADSVVGPAGRGTTVRVDSRGIAMEGSVSVIDLNPAANGNPPREILTGVHAGALARSPDGRYVVVANTGSDTLSVIDTRSDKVVDTLSARQNPGDPFGAQPDAMAFDRSGRRLYVCNGTQNAVAVFQFKTRERFLGLLPVHRFEPGRPRLLGLIPVGWFPAGIVHDARRDAIYVANLKHLAAGRAGKSGRPEFNTKQYSGSLSLVPVPSDAALAAHTRIALANLRYPLLARAALPARPDLPPRPVPERVGEPGVFRHVIYVIKENRTYDQVLGDVKEGDGNAELCVFGERVTPNQHKLAREFVLLDNTCCSGILSADGHEWADTALATEYVEREFNAWPRSYPSGGDAESDDALAYSSAGFIWDHVLARGKSFRDYGEFATSISGWKDPGRNGKPRFSDYYRAFLNGSDEVIIGCRPDLESLRPYLATNTVGWDLDVPDVARAAKFIDELKQFEAADNLPEFIVLWLPNDHTSGTKAGSPTPAAQVADNDLALGRIVEALSHSKYWKDTCLFAIEDDPQDGWDHVSGYRTTAYVASAWTKRGAVVSTQYNQTSLLRTIELILGLPPMNQMDATATPMFDCFAGEPDFTPFDAATNNVPLDTMNPNPKKISDPLLRRDALRSARLPLEKADQCPEDALNRILWRATKGPRTPYPEWAARAGDED